MVRHRVLIANDDLIADILNRKKLVTGHGNRWTRERVTALRCHRQIPGTRLNLTKTAALIDVSSKTLRLAAESGEIDANHPLRDVRGLSAKRFSPDQPGR